MSLTSECQAFITQHAEDFKYFTGQAPSGMVVIEGVKLSQACYESLLTQLRQLDTTDLQTVLDRTTTTPPSTIKAIHDILPETLIPDLSETGLDMKTVRPKFRRAIISRALESPRGARDLPDYCQSIDPACEREKTVNIAEFRLRPREHQAIIERLSDAIDAKAAAMLLDPSRFDFTIEANSDKRQRALSIIKLVLPDGLFDTETQRKRVRRSFLERLAKHQHIEQQLASELNGREIQMLLDPRQFDMTDSANDAAKSRALAVVKRLLPDEQFKSPEQRKQVRRELLSRVLAQKQGPSRAPQSVASGSAPLAGKVKIWRGRWSTSDLRRHSNALFIFGDNDAQTGKGGQAIIRDMPNAVGIPTQKRPTGNDTKFYNDKDFRQNCQNIDDAIDKIVTKAADRETVYFPQGGIGTGLSELASRAPETYKYLNKRILEVFGVVNSGESTLSRGS